MKFIFFLSKVSREWADLPFEVLLEGKSREAEIRANRISFDEVDHTVFTNDVSEILLWGCS